MNTPLRRRRPSEARLERAHATPALALEAARRNFRRSVLKFLEQTNAKGLVIRWSYSAAARAARRDGRRRQGEPASGPPLAPISAPPDAGFRLPASGRAAR
jgi:hypothetical protein